MNKNLLRKNIASLRDNIVTKERESLNERIYNNFITSELYKNSNVIFTYISFRSEVETKRLIDTALNDNKIVCVPKIDTKSNYMDVIKITSLDDLKENKFGTLEPIDDNNIIDYSKIDLVITPGLAFDLSGNRTGYGKGYYDRFFNNISDKVIKVALAYKLQIVNSIDADEHDIKVNYIITEERIISTDKVDKKCN